MVERKPGSYLRARHVLAVLALVFGVSIIAQPNARASDPGVAVADVDESENPETKRLKELSLDHWIERSNRLQRIAQRVQIAGAEICERTVSPILGAAILDVEKIHKSLTQTAKARFGNKHRFYVTSVFESMASGEAGLQVGDAILRLNGTELKSESDFYGFKRREPKPNQLEVQRGGKPLELRVETVYGCRYPAAISFNMLINGEKIINAYATGDSIQFTAGYMRYFDDDASVAGTVGHELGHNIFWNPGSRRRGGWASRRSEARADYVGLYLAAMAGYPLLDTQFLEYQNLSGVEDYSEKGSHPSTPERIVAARKTIEEIEGTLQRGEPLELRFE